METKRQSCLSPCARAQSESERVYCLVRSRAVITVGKLAAVSFSLLFLRPGK